MCACTHRDDLWQGIHKTITKIPLEIIKLWLHFFSVQYIELLFLSSPSHIWNMSAFKSFMHPAEETSKQSFKQEGEKLALFHWIFFQTTPSHILSQLDKVLREASTLDGVLEFRHEHFWTLSFGVLVSCMDCNNSKLIYKALYAMLIGLQINHY